MKANELRIGNLFYPHRMTDAWSVVAIDTLKGKDYLIVMKSDDELKGTEVLSRMKPIPLTEEWLEKFGFEKKENSYKNGYEFNITNIGCGSFTGKRFEIYYNNEYLMQPIYYVHQLQNLYFALIGEELEIKNDRSRGIVFPA